MELLYYHLGNGVQCHWICQHEGTFQNVKQLLISESQLVLYNKHELLFHTADISSHSAGAGLSQRTH